MNTYPCSDGTRVKKSVIDRKVRESKAIKLQNQMYEKGYNSCEICDRSTGEPLDCSHIVSVDRCQKDGRSELAWDLDNIRILCRTHHNLHDKLY